MSNKPLRILVLQRGWAVIGRVSKFGPLGQYIKVENAAVIRRWGTSKGLGELAEKGPLQNTVLDECPPITCHELTVCFQMDCSEGNHENR